MTAIRMARDRPSGENICSQARHRASVQRLAMSNATRRDRLSCAAQDGIWSDGRESQDIILTIRQHVLDQASVLLFQNDKKTFPDTDEPLPSQKTAES